MLMRRFSEARTRILACPFLSLFARYVTLFFLVYRSRMYEVRERPAVDEPTELLRNQQSKTVWYGTVDCYVTSLLSRERN